MNKEKLTNLSHGVAVTTKQTPTQISTLEPPTTLPMIDTATNVSDPAPENYTYAPDFESEFQLPNIDPLGIEKLLQNASVRFELCQFLLNWFAGKNFTFSSGQLVDPDLHIGVMAPSSASPTPASSLMGLSGAGSANASAHGGRPYWGDAFFSFQAVYWPIHCVICLVICTLGIFANVTNIIVLTRPNMISAVNTILSAMAFSDLVVNISNIPYLMHELGDSSNFTSFYSLQWALYILFHAHTSVTAHTISIWLTCVLATWRYCVVCRSQSSGQSRNWDVSLAKRMIVGVFLLVPIFCIPNYLSFSIVKDISETNSTIYKVGFSNLAEESQFLKTFHFWIFSCLTKLLPCVLLTYFTTVLIRKLLSARDRRLRLATYGSNPVDASASASTGESRVSLGSKIPNGGAQRPDALPSSRNSTPNGLTRITDEGKRSAGESRDSMNLSNQAMMTKRGRQTQQSGGSSCTTEATEMIGTGSCSTSNTSTQAQAPLDTAATSSGADLSRPIMSQMVVESTTTDSTTTFSVPGPILEQSAANVYRQPALSPSPCFVKAESPCPTLTCVSMNLSNELQDRFDRLGSGVGLIGGQRLEGQILEQHMKRANSQDMGSSSRKQDESRQYPPATSTSRASLLVMDQISGGSLSNTNLPSTDTHELFIRRLNQGSNCANLSQEKRASETIQLNKRGRSMGSTTLAPFQMIKLQAAQRQISHNETTTRLLIAVMIVFLICEFPAGILAALCAALGQDFFENIYVPAGSITDLLALINSSVNFILYCFMSTQFRVTFYRVVLHCPAPNLSHQHQTQAVIMNTMNHANEAVQEYNIDRRKNQNCTSNSN